MIRSATEINFVPQIYNTKDNKSAIQSSVASSPLSFEDRITISANAFRVETNIEDYLPQARDPKQKSFKSVKEYAEYLLMLVMKLRELKPQPGELRVKMEDKAQLHAVIDDLSNVKLT